MAAGAQAAGKPVMMRGDTNVFRSFCCPHCGGGTQVTDSRGVTNGVRRRRRCMDCKERFTTYEFIGEARPGPDMVAKYQSLLNQCDQLGRMAAFLANQISTMKKEAEAMEDATT